MFLIFLLSVTFCFDISDEIKKSNMLGMYSSMTSPFPPSEVDQAEMSAKNPNDIEASENSAAAARGKISAHYSSNFKRYGGYI